VNTLATYVKQGGKLWLTGGGAASGVSYGFNDPNNDQPTKTWDVASVRNELGPGRFMFDIAKWQSRFRILRPEARIKRALGRYEGDWDPNTLSQGPPKKYGGLPVQLEAKSYSTDPLSVEAPSRVGTTPYQIAADIEFIDTSPNNVFEDIDPAPETTNEQSVLDTLYRVSAATLPDGRERELGEWHSAQENVSRNPSFVIMTYYDGPPPLLQTCLMSGFPLWFPKREQTQQLVDYVLQQMWGMTRMGPVPLTDAQRAGPSFSAASPVRAPAGKTPAPSQRLLTPWSPKYPRE
jgi:hypothetical protein